MHILLTDITTCPRCGPGFGLILLVDELADRRVRRGALGCANCRERYPIENGRGDFTLGDVSDFGEPISADAAFRLTALAGVSAPPARLLVVGPAAAYAAATAEQIPGVEVVGATGDGALAAEAEVSRIAVARTLPFRDHSFAGVILSGRAADVLLEEGARVLAGGGRLILEPAPGAAAARLAAAGIPKHVAEGATLVAVRT